MKRSPEYCSSVHFYSSLEKLDYVQFQIFYSLYHVVTAVYRLLSALKLPLSFHFQERKRVNFKASSHSFKKATSILNLPEEIHC